MNRSDHGHSEKRNFIRMQVAADITLIHAGQVIPAVCVDLSSGGMQIQTVRLFSVGDKLSVRIDSEHQALKGLKAETEVVWINDPDNASQTLGLAILSMS